MEDRFENWKQPEIIDGKPTEYGWIVRHKENFQLGRETDIGAFCYINAKNGVVIEDEVQIGSHSSIYSVSTIDNKEAKVVLKKNCRIGSHSVVMPGVTIGENSVIGAFSFVNKDIPDNVLAYGVPAKIAKRKIPLFKIHWDDDDVRSVSSSIQRGSDWACGPNVEEFEKLISKYTGRKFAAVFNSGTSALHALLIALGIGKDDEIIVPSFSFIATANAPLFVGAKPVFADIEEETYGLDPDDVRKKITCRTKAIMPMHYGGGVSCKIKELKSIADEKGIPLIEDAAESFGARLDGQAAGTFGDAAMFSFCQTKVFTSGEGGCIITDSEDIYQKLKLLRSHGRTEDMKYISLGYNFRMADCIAALGISQIKKVDSLIRIRREKAEFFKKALRNIEDIVVPEPKNNIHHVYQEFPIRIKSGENMRNALKEYLGRRGIGTRVSFPPIHLSHYYKNVLGYSDRLENTEKIASAALTLPLYPDLSEDEISYIAQEIKNFYGK